MSDVLLFLKSFLVHGRGAILLQVQGPVAELGLLAAVAAVVFIDDLGHVVEGGEDDPEAEEHKDDGLWRKREVMMTREEEGYLTERDPLEVHSVVGVEGVPPGQLLVLDVQLAVLLDQPGPSLRNLRRHLGLILLCEAIHRCSCDNKGFLLVLIVFSVLHSVFAFQRNGFLKKPDCQRMMVALII